MSATTRKCPDCGQAEERRKDDSGRELLNLDPHTGKCIPCLITSAKAKAMPEAEPEPEYDWAKKAAGDDDD